MVLSTVGSSCMYNALKVCSFWPTVACLPDIQSAVLQYPEMYHLRKSVFLFQVKIYREKWFGIYVKKPRFLSRPKLMPRCQTGHPDRPQVFPPKGNEERDLLWIVSPSVEPKSFLAFHADISAVDTAAALTDKTRLKEPDLLVFFFILPKYHIIYAVEK